MDKADRCCNHVAVHGTHVDGADAVMAQHRAHAVLRWSELPRSVLTAMNAMLHKHQTYCIVCPALAFNGSVRLQASIFVS